MLMPSGPLGRTFLSLSPKPPLLYPPRADEAGLIRQAWYPGHWPGCSPPVCKMDSIGSFQRAGQTASRRKTRRTTFRRRSRQGAPPFVCWILEGSPGTMYRDDSFMEQFVSWCFKNGHFSSRSGSHLPFLQESIELIECLMVIRCNFLACPLH